MAAVAQGIPDVADPKWKELNQALKDLALELLNDDAMRRNKTQPFMTPAHDKNLVYFLWDSVTRTLVRLPLSLFCPPPLLLFVHDLLPHTSIPQVPSPSNPKTSTKLTVSKWLRSPQADVYNVPPQLQASRAWCPAFRKMWTMECLTKSKYLASMILGPSGPDADPMTMMLNMMMAQSGDAPEMSDDIKQAAQRLRDI